jgi:hypothetical protein
LKEEGRAWLSLDYPRPLSFDVVGGDPDQILERGRTSGPRVRGVLWSLREVQLPHARRGEAVGRLTVVEDETDLLYPPLARERGIDRHRQDSDTRAGDESGDDLETRRDAADAVDASRAAALGRDVVVPDRDLADS